MHTSDLTENQLFKTIIGQYYYIYKHTTMKKKFTAILLLAAMVATLAISCAPPKNMPHPPKPPTPAR